MISIIVAVARGGVIGGENRLLWHISEDLKRFKKITSGHPVIMGRKTYQSLGRPLPNRENIVITRNPNFSADGVRTAGSLAQAIEGCQKEEQIFIIGGGEIYREAMQIADRLYITEIDGDFDGDVFFPEIDMQRWEQVEVESHEKGEEFPHPFRYITYQRQVGRS